MMVPDDLLYTAEHEWVRRQDGLLRVGITHYAQDQLGDVVYIALPEVGSEVRAHEGLGEVESTKSVSDLYAPVSGRVVARNDALLERPELVNSDPYGDGWMVEIEPSDPSDLDALLDAGAYRASTS